MMSLVILSSWGVFLYNNPMMLALVLAQMCVLVSCYLAVHAKLVGFILFLVYVGGLMILISYCVMLIPHSKFSLFTWIPAVFLSMSNFGMSQYALGLSLCFNIILFMAVFLFFVMLSIVTIVDYSDGMVKW